MSKRNMVLQALQGDLQELVVMTRNGLRALNGAKRGYLVMPLGGSLPERPPPPRTLTETIIESQLPIPSSPTPISIAEISERFERIIISDHVEGVVLILRPFTAGLATLQSLRKLIHELKAYNKRVVAYTPHLDLSNYYVASSAHMIVAPPSARFEVLGLQVSATYWKNVLDKVGVKSEMIRISPYKTAGSTLTETDMTPQERQQFNWILDDTYDTIINQIAHDRFMAPRAVEAIIDRSPLTVRDAMQNHVIDRIGYEDQLPRLIAERWPHWQRNERLEQVKLVNGKKAVKQLRVLSPKTNRQYIGVLNIDGMITMNAAGSPIPIPIPGIGGSNTASQAELVPTLRRVEEDEDMAALVVYINSPGGDALASDLIWRQIERLRTHKPVVAYMGDVAASGGYYIAAASDKIIAKPSTTTGSIGVVAGRISTSGVLEKLNVRQEQLNRGRHAGLYRNSMPMNEEEFNIIWSSIVDTYQRFKDIVSQSRGLPFEQLDNICLGRVWTGRQAYHNKLIDQLGDFRDAVEEAKQLTTIPPHKHHLVPVRDIQIKNGYVKPHPLLENVPDEQPNNPLSPLLQFVQSPLFQLLDGRPLTLMPFDMRIRF